MRYAMLAMLAPALLFAACRTDEMERSPSGATEPTAAKKASALPISGRCEGTFEFLPINYLPPPQDDLAAHARLPFRGTCRVSHLGKSSTLGEDLVDFTVDPFVATGTRVLIAADGTELWMSEETATPAPGENPVFTSTGTFTFTGGTGRFQSASGTARFSGGGSIADFSNHLEFEGTLTLAK
jgi:hypothetical protein